MTSEPTRNQRKLSAKKRKKLALFRAGAQAIHCLVPERENLYACPLCRKLWIEQAVDAGVLTLEHVPPASVGGRGLVLTCKDCNNVAGSAIDAHLRGRHDFIEAGRALYRGQSSPKISRRGELRVGNEETEADLELDGRRLTIHSRAPQQSEAIRRADSSAAGARDRGEPSPTVSLRFGSRKGWEMRPSLISDLKAAFLAAFALLGYRYALDERLDPIRGQIRDPERVLIQGAWWRAPPDLTEDPTIILAHKPFPCLLVRMGDMLVTLSWVSSPADFFDRLRSHFGQQGPSPFSGTEYEWPSTLDLIWDLQFCPPPTDAQPAEVRPA